MGEYSRSVQVVRERSYDTFVSLVESVVPAGRWLDVGCSFGWLLSYVRNRGFEPYGVELSPGAASVARKNGLQVSVGRYPEVDGGGAPYQVISIIDVLEHLHDPLSALQTAWSHLSPDGVLLVQVPDREVMLYRTALLLFRITRGYVAHPLQRLYLYGFDSPHVCYHSRNSLSTLLESSGFRMVQEQCAAIGSLDTVVHRVRYVQGSTMARAASWLLAFGVATLQLAHSVRGHGGLILSLSRRTAKGELMA
jgi:SAM-dependent methyltransferase